jgi:hypothetical protein
MGWNGWNEEEEQEPDWFAESVDQALRDGG